ncbi:hypothetical protein N7454_000028 [Penicillium verhagenii]|nr:hypothetical protein N7454_000028 [Penicillium verhagenii]
MNILLVISLDLVHYATSASIHMLSSGHPCLRRRLSAVLDTVAAAPEDPLLFLYPRWAASALQQRRTIASLAPAAASIQCNRAPSNPIRTKTRSYPFPPPLSRHSSQWSSPGALSSSPNSSTPVRDGAVGSSGVNDSPDAIRLGHETVGFSQGLSQESNEFLETASDTPKAHYKSRGNLSRREWRHKRIAGQREAAKKPQEQDTEMGLSSRKVSVGRLSVRDKRKLRSGDFLRRRRGSDLFRSSVDAWNDMKLLLEEVHDDPRTKLRRSTKSKELQIPEETVALLAGVMNTSLNENIWYVHVRNGCKVRILHPSESDGAHRKVILTGSEHVMETVEGLIKNAQASQDAGDPLVDIRKPPVPIFLEREILSRKNITIPKIRGTWNFRRLGERPLRLKDVLASRSSLNTVKDFAEHIEDLTNAKEPSNGLLKSQKVQWSPDAKQISRHILNLFRDASYHPIISTAALNRALEFMCKHEQLSAARIVFVGAEHVATVDTYNVLLRSAAQRHDTWAFRKFLAMMPRSNIRPNAETWLALLAALTTSKSKASLITHMVQRGLMADVKVIRTALQLTIQDSLLVHLESGQDVESFVALMEKTHGANWFSPSLLGQMFSVAARCKDFSATDALLKVCTENGFAIDSSILNQILLMCRANILTALNYTFECAKSPCFHFVPQIWERLFLIAFKGQNYNICRVLWRYACMDGSVTRRMMQTVISSLTRNVSFKKSTNQMSKIWATDAAKVIVGIDTHLEDYKIADSALKEIPSEFHDTPLAFLTSGYMPDGEQRLHQMNLAKYLVGRDLSHGARFYTPVNDISIMLQAAAIIDGDWKGVPRPLTWKMQNAIQVPIKRDENWHKKV